ncbi:transmembrane channel-like protein 7 isoform X2 [Neocloeon triangulifer]|uniref:transmembrane channel-like protein 7 isoform X2 n=1 Tax=Neocloeon triangulifer TaxID=2078957 RepID=UPI00286F9EE7|nr:transmembrane channel-like protein 7 isoform X2 [Neocloeon triangulifer]
MVEERRRGSHDAASISDIDEDNETEDTENIPMNDLVPPIIVTDNGGVGVKVVDTVLPNNNHSARRRPRPNHLHININSASSDLESLPSHNVAAMTPISLSPSWAKPHRLIRTRKASQCSTPGYVTLRNPTHRMSTSTYAEELIQAIENDDTLMADSPASEQLRLQTVRGMAEAMELKRNVKAKLCYNINIRNQNSPSDPTKWFKYRLKKSFRKVNCGTREFLSNFELWGSTIKSIEGRFGTGVATYFRFLRSLFLINLCVFAMSFCFMVFPQLLDRFYGWNNATNSANSSIMVLEPKVYPYEEINSTFNFGDLVTGGGVLADTELFYGSYCNHKVHMNEGEYYNMPDAYFFTTAACYLFTVIVLSIKVAKSYRKNFIEMQGGFTNVYAQRIFCGWDFGITNSEAAELRKQTLYNELRELLDEESNAERSGAKTLLQRFIVMACRVGVTVLVGSLLIGSGVLVWFLLERQYLLSSKDLGTKEGRQQASMMMSLVVTGVMLILPMIFSRLCAIEQYSNPRNSVFITLLRTFGLEVAIVGVLLAYWMRKSPVSHIVCWETSLGQETYRLILVDFFIALLGTSLAEFIRAVVYRYVWKGIGAPEFDIARNTLNLIYNQTLFWVGFYYSPLLSAVIVIKLFITFYVKQACVLHNCKPPSRSWRAAQIQTVFLALTFLAIIGVIFSLGYTMTRVPTSKGCGPFRDFGHAYEIILRKWDNIDRDSNWYKIGKWVFKPGVVAGYIIALCVGVYYMRAVAHARGVMVELLRNMLVLEAEDKIFLQKNIREAKCGRWEPSPLNRGRIKPLPVSSTASKHQSAL